MSSYIINFSVYTFAMVGLMFLAVFIYKKTSNLTSTKKNSYNKLEIEEKLALSVKKALYVIKAGEERFLIASDMDRTSFLAKLNSQENINTDKTEISNPNHINNDIYKIYENEKPQKQPVMRELLRKLNKVGA